MGLVIGLLLTPAADGLAQPVVKDLLYRKSDEGCVLTEQQPAFPGGSRALMAYLQKNVQYPSAARRAGVSGRVFLSFIVETDGRLTDLQLLKGLGFGCDEEAMRVVNAMPAWTPGSQDGKPLRVKYNLPVRFGVDYPKTRGD